RAFVFLANAHRFGAIARLEHRVTIRPQHPACQHANALFVLGEKQGLGAARALTARIARRPRPWRRVDARQEDLEQRAATRSAFDADVSTGLLDDAEDCRQPQSGPFADALGGEERLEDAAARRLIHAAPGVADR